MLMAHAVTQLANRTPGKEAVAMESFAKALRMVSYEERGEHTFHGLDFKLNIFLCPREKFFSLPLQNYSSPQCFIF
jgi:hypothetical protein